jgi:hypothetical protein
MWLEETGMIDLTYGTWGSETSQKSSNFREFANFVRRVEQLVNGGQLKIGTKLFLFTDNFVTEMIWHKGTARSFLLHGLVQRLRKLEMDGSLFIVVVWVAGIRMIAQGTDGLSHGDLFNGVLAGQGFLSFVPLNKTAIEQSEGLLEWLTSTFPRKKDWKVLDKIGWFEEGFEDGNHIWAPPPAIADVVLDNLCESVLIRPWNSHIFICPALMTAKWRKQLRKVTDLVVTIPAGSTLWPQALHEPVVLALICPILNYSPWQVRNTRRLVELAAALPRVWSSDWSVEVDSLRKFWGDEVPEDPSMIWGLARRLLQTERRGSVPCLRAKDPDDSILDPEDLEDDDPDRFRVARGGDHMMCPF